MKMKKTFLTLLAVLSTALLFSCDNGGDDPTPVPGEGDLVISASVSKAPTGIEVYLMATMGGVDITSSTSFVNTTDGAENALPSSSFVSATTGDYTFKAIYQGETSVNEISVSIVDPLPAYARTVALFRYTGTWCVFCPGMSTPVHQIEQQYPGSYHDIAIHVEQEGGTNPSPDQRAVALYTQAGYYYVEKHNINSFPSLIVNDDPLFAVSSRTTTAIINASKASVNNNPYAAGIKLSTSKSGNSVKVDAEVMPVVGGNYRLHVALLLDGFKYEQTGGSEGYTQSNVLYQFFQSDVAGEDLGALEMGKAVTKSYTADISKAIATAEASGEDIGYEIVAWVSSIATDSKYYSVNNLAACPLGESVDYRFENLD